MQCSYCQSKNTTSKIIQRSKGSRNFLVFSITFLTVVIAMIIMGAIAEAVLQSLFVGVVIAIPISLLALIISCFIPTKQKIVFVCNECGKITKV